MSVSHLQDERELNSSTTNLHSSSTQTTLVVQEPSNPALPIREEVTLALQPPRYKAPPAVASSASSYETPPESVPAVSDALRVSCRLRSHHGSDAVDDCEKETSQIKVSNPFLDVPVDDQPSSRPILTHRTSENGAGHIDGITAPPLVSGCRQGFVSSKHLQEILHDLSVDARRSSSNPVHQTSLAPDSPPLHSYFPSISPYAMRKRRPPFHPYKNNPSPYYYPGSAPPSRRTNTNPPGKQHEQTADLKGPGACEVHLGVRSQSSSWNRRDSVRPRDGDSYGYSDSESSSSEDYCYYHRPYCESCRASSSSDTSDSDYHDLYTSSHPVVFKEDLEPTLV